MIFIWKFTVRLRKSIIKIDIQIGPFIKANNLIEYQIEWRFSQICTKIFLWHNILKLTQNQGPLNVGRLYSNIRNVKIMGNSVMRFL